MDWYLRSLGDLDTHYGTLRGDGTVLPLCGIVFIPRKLVGDRLTLSGEPQDSAQVCPQCTARRASQRALKSPESH